MDRLDLTVVYCRTFIIRLRWAVFVPDAWMDVLVQYKQFCLTKVKHKLNTQPTMSKFQVPSPT
jgi:hypothetical protein